MNVEIFLSTSYVFWIFHNSLVLGECSIATGSLATPLQPRPATTGSVDGLPLQPRFLPNFQIECRRESRSEPRDVPKKNFLQEYSPVRNVETELGLASVPAMAIGSSTEILVSIVENQAGFRRNSFLSVNPPKQESGNADNNGHNKRIDVNLNVDDLKSPDFEFAKSPSTEMTNPSDQSTPNDLVKDVSSSNLELDRNFNNFQICDNTKND